MPMAHKRRVVGKVRQRDMQTPRNLRPRHGLRDPAGRQKTDRDVACSTVGGTGCVIQRRLAPAPELAAVFGPRLWSVRLLVLVTAAAPLIHRAVAKIAVGRNPADNFWRVGNMIGAIDASNSRITRVVRGTGMDQRMN